MFGVEGLLARRRSLLAHEGNPVLRLLTITPDGGVLKVMTAPAVEVLTMDFSLIDFLDEDACYGVLRGAAAGGCPRGTF
jgi:hypothetical protein